MPTRPEVVRDRPLYSITILLSIGYSKHDLKAAFFCRLVAVPLGCWSQVLYCPLIPDDIYISLDRVRMVYGDRRVFDSLSCGFPRGKISVILGGSGSGKSTILRLIGGL